MQNRAILFVIFLMGAAVSSSARADIFQDYPQNQTVTLSNGRNVELPLHLYDYDQLVLGGAADRAAVQLELAGTDLFVAPLTDLVGNVLSETLTGVSIFVIDYDNTSLGAYQETIVTVPVFDAGGRFGYYVLSMHVTQRYSQKVGREVLGLPKELGVIWTSTPATGAWSFLYGDDNGLAALGSCSQCGQLPAFPLSLDFEVATRDPANGEIVWFRILNQTTRFSTRPYDAAHDAFWANPGAPVGQLLSRVHFSTTGAQWLVSRDVQGVTFTP